jgi:hypothetical protein
MRLNHGNMFNNNKTDNSWTEWQSIPTRNTIMKIVGRASNRIFVGLPLCTWFLSIECYGLEIRRQGLWFHKAQCSVRDRCYADGYHSSNGSWLFETVSYEMVFFNDTQLLLKVLLTLSSPWSRSALSTAWNILHL